MSGATPSYFLVDVETTGCAGIPAYSDINRVLQICCLHHASGDVFNRICNPGLGAIPLKSVECHRITHEQAMQFNPLEDVMDDFLQWVKEKEPQGSRVCMVAHNAPFDRRLIYKALGVARVGEDGEKLGWVWVDTLKVARDLYPGLSRRFWPAQRPYSLGNLVRHLNVMEDGIAGAHNAEADVRALGELFFKAILPKGTPASIHPLPGGPTRRRKLSDVEGFGKWRVAQLVKQINYYLGERFHDSEGDDLMLMEGPLPVPTNEHYCTVAHVIMLGIHLCLYGPVRWSSDEEEEGADPTKRAPPAKRVKRPREDSRPEPLDLDSLPDMSWFNICKAVETLLRSPPLDIHSDAHICALLAAMCGVTEETLCFNTMRDSGLREFFPCTGRTPIAYLPLELTQGQCDAIYKATGAKSATELDGKFELMSSPLHIQVAIRKANRLLEDGEKQMDAGEIIKGLKKLRFFKKWEM